MGGLAGAVLGKYRIVEKIGSGSMADVYRGIQIGLERDVAIKVLPPVLTSDPIMRERFRRGWLATARLSHPNIITVFDSGEQAGVCFTVMEYLISPTLEDRLDEDEVFDPARIAKIGQDILKGLAFAHEKQVFHRGLSGSNVKFDIRGNAILTDFGRVEGEGQAEEDLVAVGNLLARMLSAEAPSELSAFAKRAVAGGPDGFASARSMLAQLKDVELLLRARRVADGVTCEDEPVFPPIRAYVAERASQMVLVASEDSLGYLSSLSAILSHHEERQEVARVFSWAVPLFLFVLVGAGWLVRIATP